MGEQFYSLFNKWPNNYKTIFEMKLETGILIKLIDMCKVTHPLLYSSKLHDIMKTTRIFALNAPTPLLTANSKGV